MRIDQLGYPRCDVFDGMGSRHGFESAIGATHRLEQTVRMQVLLGQRSALLAREALIHRVGGITNNLDRATLFDRDLDATKGVTKTTERLLDNHGGIPDT